MSINNRVWIEIERPKGTPEERKQIGEERAKALSALLAKLGVKPHKDGDTVWYTTRERHEGYCLTVDEAGGFLELNDSGHWFDLDRLSA